MTGSRTFHGAAIALLALLVGASCGGGGGGTPGGPIIPGPLIATFAADAGCSGGNEIALTPGGSANDTFDVAVRATGLSDFFGAAFNVDYDPATAVFLGSSSAGSFLLGGGSTLFFAELEGGTAGMVNVEASLQGNGAGISPTAGNDLLITLTFRATDETTGNDFSVVTPREVQTCATAGSACTMVPNATVAFCGGSLTASN